MKGKNRQDYWYRKSWAIITVHHNLPRCRRRCSAGWCPWPAREFGGRGSCWTTAPDRGPGSGRCQGRRGAATSRFQRARPVFPGLPEKCCFQNSIVMAQGVRCLPQNFLWHTVNTIPCENYLGVEVQLLAEHVLPVVDVQEPLDGVVTAGALPLGTAPQAGLDLPIQDI